jgi:hypothetical protein
LWFLGVGLPTIMFYGWMVFFGWLALRGLRPGHSKLGALLFAVIACAPVAWYGAEYAAASFKQRRLEAVVREAANLPKLTDAPRTLVIHAGRSTSWQDQLVEMGAFDALFITWRNNTIRLANTRRAGCDHGTRGNVRVQNIYRARTGFLVCATETKVSGFPADGLHFYLTPPQRSTSGRLDWLGYYELKLIEGGKERVVGFNGSPRISYPVFPPVISTIGFIKRDVVVRHIVPWYGEIPFLFGRLNLDAARLRPMAQPSPEEVRAEFLRLRDSGDRADLFVAGLIATATGAAALTADDVAPVLQSNVVDYDFGREIGFQQFCYHINRLCDFPDALIAACKRKRSPKPGARPQPAAALSRCDRLPRQCNWCRTTPQCRPSLDGQVLACGKEQSAARDVSLKPLRAN